MPALLSDCGVGWVGCRGRGNREGDLLPLSWPSSTQISWPLPASRVFQRVHSYCLRSSVSDLENAITTSSAPADQGKEPLAGPLVSGCSQDNTRWPGSPIHWSIMLVHCTVVPPHTSGLVCFQGQPISSLGLPYSPARAHASNPAIGWQGECRGEA